MSDHDNHDTFLLLQVEDTKTMGRPRRDDRVAASATAALPSQPQQHPPSSLFSSLLLPVLSNSNDNLNADEQHSPRTSNHLRSVLTAPPQSSSDYGLLITLSNDSASDDSRKTSSPSSVTLTFCRDANFPSIHPHVHAPADFSDLQALAGGGSGAAVFGGHHPLPFIGDVVMKHGGCKETMEHLALAQISHQLKRRTVQLQTDRVTNGTSTDTCTSSSRSTDLWTGGIATPSQAAADLKRRIPEFKLCYIAPQHLCDKQDELWGRLRYLLLQQQPHYHDDHPSDRRRRRSSIELDDSSRLSTTEHHVEDRPGRAMRIVSSDNSERAGVSIQLHKDVLDIVLPPNTTTWTNVCNTNNTKQQQAEEEQEENDAAGAALLTSADSIDFSLSQQQQDGCASLQALLEPFEQLQKEKLYKFTLGQKTIGGGEARTASSLLAAGELHGNLLHHLIDEFLTVVDDLQLVTSPTEANVQKPLQKELARIQSDHNLQLTSADVSHMADAFCGHCLTKNWHPTKGRFVRLRDTGAQFRAACLQLTAEEEVPARHLGVLLQQDSHMGLVYCQNDEEDEEEDAISLEDTTLDLDNLHTWRMVLEHAILGVRSPAALRRVWTCGLSDAGLHNLFLSRTQLWLFDLGEPSLQSLPGFLTKFLFSFFHTLGMEEDGNGSWVNRFEVGAEDKLALTRETKALLAQAYEAFEVTLDRLSDELFFGEDGVRGLLIQYITLQLLSDSSFCLERWALKGGGACRQDNHHKGIEKWLWRALWDIYVAFDINTKEWTCEPFKDGYSVFRRKQGVPKIPKAN